MECSLPPRLYAVAAHSGMGCDVVGAASMGASRTFDKGSTNVSKNGATTPIDYPATLHLGPNISFRLLNTHGMVLTSTTPHHSSSNLLNNGPVLGTFAHG